MNKNRAHDSVSSRFARGYGSEFLTMARVRNQTKDSALGLRADLFSSNNFPSLDSML